MIIVFLYPFFRRVRHDMSCAVKTHFFPVRGKKRFLDSKESRPEEGSSGLLSQAGSLRAKPGSPLSKWGVAWESRIPLVRCVFLLTDIVPRSQPAARRLQNHTAPCMLFAHAALSADGCAIKASSFRLETHNVRYPRKKCQDRENVIRAQRPFSLWSPRTVSLFGQEPKREMGLDNAQVTISEQ